jgi:hypothetical protein
MAEEDSKTDPVPPTDPPAPPDPPNPEPVKHVSREEFDGLKGALDGLIQKVAEIAPQDPARDEAPGGRPWTHMGGRR